MKKYLVFLLAAVMLVSCSNHKYPEIVISTDLGDIIVEVYPDRACVTANNFLNLVEDNVYSGSAFYRVVRMDNQPDNNVKIEVIQGGLYEEDKIIGIQTIRHETTDETGIQHTDGVISMARLGPGTASSEFFICIGDQPGLDFGGDRNPDGQGFAAFGRVIKGMEIVRKIQAMPDSGQMLINEVEILKMEIIPYVKIE